MKKLLLRILVGVLLAIAIFYAGDYVVLRARIARSASAYGSVTVDSYYAIKRKDGRTEYDFASEQQQTCIHSVFPHMGYTPCWYLRKHTDKQINLFSRLTGARNGFCWLSEEAEEQSVLRTRPV